MFDLWSHNYSAGAEQLLRSAEFETMFQVKRVRERLRIIKGSSLSTVLEFAASEPRVKCDILSVDGGHSYKVALADLTSMKQLARRSCNILLVDDTNCINSWCLPVDAAVVEQQRRGNVATWLLHRESQSNRSSHGGLTIGTYLFHGLGQSRI